LRLLPIEITKKAFMGTVATNVSTSTSNNGLSNLLQTLTNENSPLLSTLSSPNIQSALEKAPTADIVEISDQAQQLQLTDALFGETSTASTPTDSLFSALASVGSSTTSSASGSSLNTGSALSDQLAAYQSNMQTQETQSLFDITPTTTPSSSYDVFG
jgi:hypothetical protein